MNAADLFRAAGEALFGRTWKSELAELLEVNERQVRRWASGQYDPPEGVWADLAAMIAERRISLQNLEKPVRDAARTKGEAST
jgi:hypothetical protein